MRRSPAYRIIVQPVPGVYPIRSRLCRRRRRLARPGPGTKSVRERTERRRQRDPPRPADVGVRDRLGAALSPPIQPQSSRLARTATEDAPPCVHPLARSRGCRDFRGGGVRPSARLLGPEGRLPRAGVVLEGDSSSTFRPRGSRERRWGKGGNCGSTEPARGAGAQFARPRFTCPRSRPRCDDGSCGVAGRVASRLGASAPRSSTTAGGSDVVVLTD